MGFPSMPTYERDDPFGPTGHNNILQRQSFLYQYLGVEHDGSTGRHNTPHVPRTMGRITWDGAAYSVDRFNGDLDDIDNTATGTVVLQLANGGSGYRSNALVVQLQHAGSDGDNNPGMIGYKWVAPSRLEVYLKRNGSGLSVQQSFAAADDSFFVGIHSAPVSTTTFEATTVGRRRRGEGLYPGDSWNYMVQAQGTNRVATLVEHNAAGLHNTVEIARAWACLRYDSDTSTYVIASHQGMGGGAQRISQGQIRLTLSGATPALSSPVLAFARPVSSSLTGTSAGAHTGIRKAMVPYDTCGTSTVDVFLYESYVDIDIFSSPAIYTYRWRRVDCDFSVRVHG